MKQADIYLIRPVSNWLGLLTPSGNHCRFASAKNFACVRSRRTISAASACVYGITSSMTSRHVGRDVSRQQRNQAIIRRLRLSLIRPRENDNVGDGQISINIVSNASSSSVVIIRPRRGYSVYKRTSSVFVLSVCL